MGWLVPSSPRSSLHPLLWLLWSLTGLTPRLPAVIDDTEQHGIANPFTSKLPPELQVLKEKQAHSLAPRSGQSKILRKAREKMAEEARKKVCVWYHCSSAGSSLGHTGPRRELDKGLGERPSRAPPAGGPRSKWEG